MSRYCNFCESWERDSHFYRDKRTGWYGCRRSNAISRARKYTIPPWLHHELAGDSDFGCARIEDESLDDLRPDGAAFDDGHAIQYRRLSTRDLDKRMVIERAHDPNCDWANKVDDEHHQYRGQLLCDIASCVESLSQQEQLDSCADRASIVDQCLERARQRRS